LSRAPSTSALAATIRQRATQGLDVAHQALIHRVATEQLHELLLHHGELGEAVIICAKRELEGMAPLLRETMKHTQDLLLFGGEHVEGRAWRGRAHLGRGRDGRCRATPGIVTTQDSLPWETC